MYRVLANARISPSGAERQSELSTIGEILDTYLSKTTSLKELQREARGRRKRAVNKIAQSTAAALAQDSSCNPFFLSLRPDNNNKKQKASADERRRKKIQQKRLLQRQRRKSNMLRTTPTTTPTAAAAKGSKMKSAGTSSHGPVPFKRRLSKRRLLYSCKKVSRSRSLLRNVGKCLVGASRRTANVVLTSVVNDLVALRRTYWQDMLQGLKNKQRNSVTLSSSCSSSSTPSARKKREEDETTTPEVTHLDNSERLLMWRHFPLFGAQVRVMKAKRKTGASSGGIVEWSVVHPLAIIIHETECTLVVVCVSVKTEASSSSSGCFELSRPLSSSQTSLWHTVRAKKRFPATLGTRADLLHLMAVAQKNVKDDDDINNDEFTFLEAMFDGNGGQCIL